jgi:hypothetical protein
MFFLLAPQKDRRNEGREIKRRIGGWGQREGSEEKGKRAIGDKKTQKQVPHQHQEDQQLGPIRFYISFISSLSLLHSPVLDTAFT